MSAVVSLADRKPHADVIEKLRTVLERVESGELCASRMVIAVQSRFPGGREFSVFVAGDFNGPADEVGLLHLAAHTRMIGELE